jgi:8-oxo-dGTP pyrophosphatase MutT (NUDIX family)
MWKKLSTKKLFDHPRLLVEEDEVELASGKKIQYLRYGYGGDGVVLIAKNNKGEILFNKEYSYVPNRHLLQLPMGKIEDGEDPVPAANRELQEETGMRAEKLTVEGSYYQNHRRSDNKGIVVLAVGLVESRLEGDIEEEGIEGSVWVGADRIGSLIKSGDIVDADTLSSLRIAGF